MLEERDSVDKASEESKPVDTAAYFAEVKRKFYEQDTQFILHNFQIDKFALYAAKLRNATRGDQGLSHNRIC